MDRHLPLEPTDRRALILGLLVALAGAAVVVSSVLSHPFGDSTAADAAVTGIHLLFFAATTWCAQVLFTTLAEDYRRFVALRHQ